MRYIHVTLAVCTALMLQVACPSTGGDGDNQGLCGNGLVNPGEECDDGNRLDHDGCSATCQVEGFCGNGDVEPGEECDDSNFDDGDGCTSTCRTEVGCGDGRLEVGEQCDDDNLTDGDGCNALCQDEVPGSVCGNEIHEQGELCDDGNTENGDGCNADCKREDGCGDGEVQDPELCDDGNTVSGDGCSDGCRVEFVCGNDFCESENYETCYLCPTDCCPDCGNGVLDAGEECDDANHANDDGCDQGCGDEDGSAECGNGLWEAGEECEDGNLTIHDGCSDTCDLEFECGDQVCEDTMGETCERCQQDCCPNCGNGVLETLESEQCDLLDFGDITCLDYCYSGGSIQCTSSCDIDLSACTGTLPVCGNDSAECGEQCDGDDFAGATCADLGYNAGSLVCNGSCGFDYSQCSEPNTCLALLNFTPGTPDGVYTFDPDGAGSGPSYEVYCDMTTDGGGWTLVAALSNSDSVKNWVQPNPWWYATTPSGDSTDPATTSDAISRAYYTVVAQEFMIKDSTSGAAYRRSMDNCLGDRTFGAMIASLGFTPGTSGVNSCLKECDMIGAGTLDSGYYAMAAADRARFGCNDSTDTAAMITLKTDTTYYYDTMTQCNEADHGLGSMESPPWSTSSSSDVGYGGSTTSVKVYLYVR
jgi:cysteine-rich repeat protein